MEIPSAQYKSLIWLAEKKEDGEMTKRMKTETNKRDHQKECKKSKCCARNKQTTEMHFKKKDEIRQTKGGERQLKGEQ